MIFSLVVPYKRNNPPSLSFLASQCAHLPWLEQIHPVCCHSTGYFIWFFPPSASYEPAVSSRYNCDIIFIGKFRNHCCKEQCVIRRQFSMLFSYQNSLKVEVWSLSKFILTSVTHPATSTSSHALKTPLLRGFLSKWNAQVIKHADLVRRRCSLFCSQSPDP